MIAIISLIPAFLQRKIFDFAIPNQDIEALVLILAGVVVINILVFLFNILGDAMLTQLVEDNRFRIKRELYSHILKLPFPFYEKVSLGEVHKVIEDGDQLSEIPRLYLAELFKNAFVVLMYYPLLFFLSYKLTLIRLAGFPFEMLLGRYFLKKDRAMEQEMWSKQGKIASLTNETYLGIRTLKTLQGEQEALRKMRIAHLDLKDCKIRRRKNNYNWQMLNSLISNLLSSIIFFFAAWDIIHGHFTFGSFIAFNIIHNQGSQALSGLVNVYKKMGTLQNPINRYESVRKLPTEYEKDGSTYTAGSQHLTCQGDIEFRNVSFAYNRDSMALENISLSIPSGSHVALVGPSGSGKTTLVNLLLRLYSPQNGAIFIQGIPLKQWDIASIRHSIAVVQQETFLFEASIRDNLTFGTSGINDGKIWEALMLANAADFIHALPGGLDVVYGAKGTNFSGGQKQRLSIARLFIRDPSIVILDEATSSQDLENERMIQDALMKLRNGRTTISIAHRLNTVANADTIYVFNQGHIVQEGRHEELISQSGLYSMLFSNMGNFYG